MCTVGSMGWHTAVTGAVCTEAIAVTMGKSLDLYTLSFNHNAMHLWQLN